MAADAQLVVMGRIAAPHGIRGWVKLKAFTAEPDGLARHPRWWIRTAEGWREARPEGFEVRPGATVAKLAGCDDREGAERLRGAEVAVRREDLGEAGQNEIYWVDLVGLEVVDAAGESLGRVDGLLEAGESDVLVVRGAKERLIPFVGEYVRSVDRAAGRIVVDWEAEYDA